MNRFALWLSLTLSGPAMAASYLDRDDVIAGATALARFALVFGMAFVLGEAGASALLVLGQRLVWRWQQVSG